MSGAQDSIFIYQPYEDGDSPEGGTLIIAQFIYFVAISGIAVNYVLFNSIVLNSILTSA